MDIKDSPLQKEVDKILEDGKKPIASLWKAEFRIREPNPVEISDAYDDVNYVDEDEKEKIYRPFKVLNIDFQRDYENGIGDYGSLRALLPVGLWLKVLFPYRDFLKVTLTRTPLKETTDELDKEEDIQTETYIAIPNITEQSSGEGKEVDNLSRFELDTHGLIEIEFQLLDQSVDALRSVEFGANFRRCTPEDLVKGVIRKESQKYSTDDGPAIEKVDMVKADLEEPREHFIIPYDTLLTEMPLYVQAKCGGIYNSGIGSYIKNKNWYVYPLYNTTRFSKEERTLTVIKAHELFHMGLERTHRVDGDKLIVIGTSTSEFKDETEVKYLSEGNGTRFGESRLQVHKFGEPSMNKFTAQRAKNNHEYLAEKRPQRNTAYVSRDRIHGNPMEEYTRLARRKGNKYSFVWENSQPELLFPGMTVKILYAKGEEMQELHGVLLKEHTTIQLKGQAITSQAHKTTTSLFIFANFPEE